MTRTEPLNPIYLTSPSPWHSNGPQAVPNSHMLMPLADLIQYQPTPTPPLRNLLYQGGCHGVYNTGPLPKLGNNLIKTGITTYCKCFFDKKIGNVEIMGVVYVIWGGGVCKG